MLTILGAGLSGLICGALNAQSQIYERNSSGRVTHRAVLRFRSDQIARALGLSFRKVTVRKAIWFREREAQPSPRIANFYSQKVRGVIAENSIWSLAPSERFIAPDDLHAVLADICGTRVKWDHEITQPILSHLLEAGPVISTIPLPLLLKMTPWDRLPLNFRHAPIYVDRYRVEDCDVFQTVYFPDPDLGLYRATLTGDLLTLEGTGAIGDDDLEQACVAFGIHMLLDGSWDGLTGLDANLKQSFGKINPLPDGERKALLHRLSVEFGIYTLGRFGTWRNILLDDVYDDIFHIRKLITMSNYDRNLERMKE